VDSPEHREVAQRAMKMSYGRVVGETIKIGTNRYEHLFENDGEFDGRSHKV
jgi:hypothetical protein